MSEIVKAMSVISQRFKSGNSVEVDSARITREEWLIIQSAIEDYMDGPYERIPTADEQDADP